VPELFRWHALLLVFIAALFQLSACVVFAYFLIALRHEIADGVRGQEQIYQ
jgi:hypothetical protein